LSHLNNDGLRHDKNTESTMLIFGQFQATCSVARWLSPKPAKSCHKKTARSC